MTNDSANSTTVPPVTPIPKFEAVAPDDATWILTSAFIIFTMQSGFGLLEAGMASKKNETNIMVKNAVDVIYGGLSYWLFGFAFSFGMKEGTNGFCGFGYFLTDAEEGEMGIVFAKYFFQLSFATTATTIVSGATAERVNLKAYTLFSLLNTLTFCFPAHWMWGNNGWLKKMGAVDIAGGGPVHLVGGVSGLVATLMLKPRTGKFDEKGRPRSMPMASPTNVLLGTFMLWWGWLGFNCGSTFGITGGKWKLASRSAVVTLNGSIGGGIFAMIYSYSLHRGKLLVEIFVTGILGGLVSITAICAVVRPWESLVIGFLGGFIACGGCSLLNRLRIDDPVGCIPTHFFCALWGLSAVGLLVEKDSLENLSENYGVLKGGKWDLLGVQLLACVSISAWAAMVTFLLLLLIDKVFFTLRMPLEKELEGADIWEHGIYANRQEDTVCCQRCGRENPALAVEDDAEVGNPVQVSVHNHHSSHGSEPHGEEPVTKGNGKVAPDSGMSVEGRSSLDGTNTGSGQEKGSSCNNHGTSSVCELSFSTLNSVNENGIKHRGHVNHTCNEQTERCI